MNDFLPTGNEVIDEVNAEALAIAQQLIAGGAPFEEVALMLPKAVIYNIVVTGNFRTWYEMLPKRMCRRAQKEHREIAYKIKDALVANYPEIFTYVKAGCDKCNERSCSFHGTN